jgi:hypothetical protein
MNHKQDAKPAGEGHPSRSLLHMEQYAKVARRHPETRFESVDSWVRREFDSHLLQSISWPGQEVPKKREYQNLPTGLLRSDPELTTSGGHMELKHGTREEHLATLKRAKNGGLSYVWSGDIRRSPYLRENLQFAVEEGIIMPP